MLFKRKHKTKALTGRTFAGIANGPLEPLNMENFSSHKDNISGFIAAFKGTSLKAAIFLGKATFICCLATIVLLSACGKKKRPNVVFQLVEETETETTAITTDQTTVETEEENKKSAVVKKKVVEKVQVEERTETIVNITTQEITTAKPPETLITTRQNNNNTANIKSAESIINTQRTSSGIGALKVDSALSKEAQYYSDCFARDRAAYEVDGYSVRMTCKVNTVNGLNNKSFKKGLEQNGFLDGDLSKIGIGISKCDNSGYYCVFIAE